MSQGAVISQSGSPFDDRSPQASGDGNGRPVPYPGIPTTCDGAEAVVHVEVPALDWGYEKNSIRRESAEQAQKIDARINRAWRGHPRVMNISAQAGFLDKLAYAIELLRGELPGCCRTNAHAMAK